MKKSVRFQEQLSYLFFGVLTSLINYGTFWLLSSWWHNRFVLLANLITFVIATAFAFVTNKLFVFKSQGGQPLMLLKEMAAFTAARLFSFAIEEIGLYLSTYVFQLGEFYLCGIDGIMITKLVLSVLAVVLNYFFSKFWVFAKKSA